MRPRKPRRGGTLFLDEIDTLSAKAQVFLLRFLQDRVYRQIGAAVLHVADVRIVAATNADLSQLADVGAFRSDLLFRLRILNVVMPPLRQRVEDIPLLAEHFLAAYSQHFKKPLKTLEPEVLELMQKYSWPGNVRELENLICRAFLLTDGPEVGRNAISELGGLEPPADSDATSASAPARFNHAKAEAISRFEVRYLSDLMARSQGNVTAAAKLAGTERRHLGRLLKKHRIETSGSRPV